MDSPDRPHRPRVPTRLRFTCTACKELVEIDGLLASERIERVMCPRCDEEWHIGITLIRPRAISPWDRMDFNGYRLGG